MGPNPNFTAGLDLTARRGAWDVAGTVFGTFGNDIFDTQKEAYVFRNFSANVRKDLLEKSWTPETANSAKYPRLVQNDSSSSPGTGSTMCAGAGALALLALDTLATGSEIMLAC